MKLAWSHQALSDRTEIFEYIDADNTRAAADLDDRFVQAAQRLLAHPGLGRPGRLPGTREFVVNPRYILVYQLHIDTLNVVAVVHTSRQWPPPE